jgi:formylglycine-generating enzyme required for sulfatase activity
VKLHTRVRGGLAIGAAGVAVVGSVLAPVANAKSAAPLAPVHLTWVTVGAPGNAPDTEVMTADRTTGYGAVAYQFSISKFLVTNQQYAAFLNAVASKSDPYLLYHPCLSKSSCYRAGSGIARTGTPGNYSYAPEAGRARRPANYVNLFDSLRFANWLNNGQRGPGSTEVGAYTLLGGTPVPTNAATIRRNHGAKIALAGENEWYKAAYYDGTKHVYYDYPAGTNKPMTCALPGPTPNTANCGLITAQKNPDNPGLPSASAWPYGDVTDVGAYTHSASPWGAFDMGGNLFQWTDTINYAVPDQYHSGGKVAPVQDAAYSLIGSPWADGVGPVGILRGTDWGDGPEFNASNGRTNDFSFYKWDTYGVRLVRLA